MGDTNGDAVADAKVNAKDNENAKPNENETVNNNANDKTNDNDNENDTVKDNDNDNDNENENDTAKDNDNVKPKAMTMAMNKAKDEMVHQLEQSVLSLDTQRKSLESEGEAIISELTAPPPEGGKPMGIHTPLVDEEGYPRNDIDVYRARHLRHRLAEIRTDHKDLMQRVDRGLKQLALYRDDEKARLAVEEQKKREAPKPPPKYDAESGQWVVSNWDGTTSLLTNSTTNEAAPVRHPDTSKEGTNPVSSPVGPVTSSDGEPATTSTSSSSSLVPFAIIDSVAPHSPASLAGLQEGDLLLKFGSAVHTNHRELRALAELIPLAAGQDESLEVWIRRPLSDTLENSPSAPLDTAPLNQKQKKSEATTKDTPIIKKNIRPKVWSGRGLVGCHILPYTEKN